MPSGSVKCPNCGRFVEYDVDEMHNVRNEYVQHRYSPHVFVCESCGHVHTKGVFEPKTHLFCSCGTDLVKEWLTV
jgi:uncharacterized Zn finger protein